jgi:hypothetical protein
MDCQLLEPFSGKLPPAAAANPRKHFKRLFPIGAFAQFPIFLGLRDDLAAFVAI